MQRELLLFPLACGESVCVEVSMCTSQKERGTSGSNLTTSAYGSHQLTGMTSPVQGHF